MVAYPHIEGYRARLEELIEFGGSDSELNIRDAFQGCLSAYCRDHRERLALVPELRASNNIVPDGTVKDSLRMARGYWEAKDSHDDLDAEIQSKFDRGYPRDNIIFEDSQTAVLIQNREEAMRADMSRPGDLHRLIRRFLDYELPEIEEFRQAQEQFKTDLPAVINSLREAVEQAESENAEYRAAAAEFLDLCRRSIGPEVSEADVREMLLQHILTKDIFLRVFAENQFHSENNIARELDKLESRFFTGDVRRQAMDRLRTYYGAIGRAADEIADYSEKQSFLKAIYEDFYKAYNPAAADRLGVVYTPNEIVDFMIRGTDELLQKHFGRSLADRNVQILDPATGTGTFITNLIEYLPEDKLEYKYLNELHANEVAILPYYIANLNIEYTYREKTGQYREFPNLVFVDTLDNMDWMGATGGMVERQSAFRLGGLSFDNWFRMLEQNEKTISVIIGNPPYNAHQMNFNDFNPNRDYPETDQRIRETYSQASSAQNRNKQYDMYKRFIRWASDRLDDDGIITFVSNRTFLDARQDDGFRRVVAGEFNELWAIDLKGNARTTSERRRREGGNIFDDKIRVGIAIYFLVRRKELSGFRIFYNAVEDYTKSFEKVDYVRGKLLTDFEFKDIAPDQYHNWLNQSNSDFEGLLSLADLRTMRGQRVDDEKAMFKLYSNGVKTHRDAWVYDFDRCNLASKVRFFARTYESRRRELSGSSFDVTELGTEIKWDGDLRKHLQKNIPIRYSQQHIVDSLYRPFTKKQLYFLRELNARQYQQPKIFPFGATGQNKVICFSVPGSNKPFLVLASDNVVDVHFTGDTLSIPLYRYTKDGERISNITEWGLKRVNEHYRKEFGRHFEEVVGGESVTAEDIFAYTYAVLHDPVYRYDYKNDLLREFPRLPLYHDFDVWRDMGRELLDLHIGFESAEPYPLERVDKSPSSQASGVKGEGAVAPRVMLRANKQDKERGEIQIDSETRLVGVPESAWRYMLGNRSALEWVLDQYKEKKPRDPTIRERFNTYRFADYKESVIELLMRVCTVSVKTMDVVDGMAYWEDGYLIVFGDRDKHEWSMMGLQAMFSREEDEEWLAEWAAMPDIRNQED